MAPETTRIPDNDIDLTIGPDSIGQVVVNGFDLSRVVGANLTLQTSVGPAREVVLTVSIPGAVIADAEGIVELDEETTAALQALGWTPPAPREEETPDE